MSEALSKEMILLILQFLDEEKFKDARHILERESGLFFDINYFEEFVMKGEWDKVEKYLLGFTKFDDNRDSMKMFFEIQKQKYLEALDKNDHSGALEILRKDLNVFSTYNEDIFNQLNSLLSLRNIRENAFLSSYVDENTARSILVMELRRLIKANPVFRDKLQFPKIKTSRLKSLLNQSLYWQHGFCKNPKGNPEIKTFFVDHTCGQQNSAQTPSLGSIPRVGGFPPLGPHSPLRIMQAPQGTSVGEWLGNPSSMPHQVGSAGPTAVAPNNAVTMLKRPGTPPTNYLVVDYQTTDSEHVLKRARPIGLPEEVNHPPIDMFPAAYPSQSPAYTLGTSENLPKTLVANLIQGSVVKTMDFHPMHQTLLVVGTNTGNIALWEVSAKERLVLRNFKVWDLGTCSMNLQVSLTNEYTASVNRVKWSPDGALLGVAFSKHIVQVYSYHGGEDLRNHLEIEAHLGSVNDIAFAIPNRRLCIITCGDDKTIKVWDAADGTKHHMFVGHEAPVYSICPRSKGNIQFIFSTGTNGKIKVWLYDDIGGRVDLDAPGHSCVRMAYSTEWNRIFSCGTTREGESFLLEWEDDDGTVIHVYQGLGKSSDGVIQFDTSKSFLAVGDESIIKFWDMDGLQILSTTDAEGGLPASPIIRFSKEGMLLAVSTIENGMKILANSDGIKLIQSIQSGMLEAPSRINLGSAAKLPGMLGISSSVVGTNTKTPMLPMTSTIGDGVLQAEIMPRTTDELVRPNIWKLTELEETSQLQSQKLPDTLLSVRISRLTYTYSGNSILALTCNAVHKFWRWPRNNITDVASTSIIPQLWQPSGGMLMTNDVSERNLEESASCFALSKNNSYIVSSSGGKVSLFNIFTSKTMATFAVPPPAATSLALHPEDNNIIAVGMDDSDIMIFNVRLDEIICKLRGHQKRVIGLDFSTVLNVLVSFGADAQLCVWNVDEWEKQTSKFLEMPSGRNPAPLVRTRVQFHKDQVHLLVVHETQLAIYKLPKLDLIKEWVPQDFNGLITDATYSSDSQSIYVSFSDGSVGVFIANSLKQRCRISLTAYLSTQPSLLVHPLAVAANPKEPNQFAVGLSDGGVHILEPLPGQENWGTAPPVESDVGPSSRCAPNQQ